ncbi:endonuclease/exonuclease/phosphatase family protein [Gilvimarinus agarilyticus]|uniref:endonuclease/exonuclease/phosphatase family protein n=1 Tax=Gilvimarinus agarilyticus TaxID=679259 RepID=UPI0005A025AE|nr:endonuclease/exonuclease/phosphatase family protein [Gilvimarinus agarilyticus]
MLLSMAITGCAEREHKASQSVKIATFNVSMEATNYLPRGTSPTPDSASLLMRELASGENAQIATVAAIVQQVRPDILLLNEFDYTADPERAIGLFQENYLARPQADNDAIHYPYFYTAPVNTGVLFPFDLNGDGEVTAPADTYGFGHYPGQYGMVLLSRYPIDKSAVRSFQHFKWMDMPGALIPQTAGGAAYYSASAWAEFRLSSKSHWDIPVNVNGRTLHLLASHPTPPVFDGPEDRNGKRNHDEVRLWLDYIGGSASYLYDDQGGKGGLDAQASFVIVGDLNSSAVEGDGRKDAISALVTHPRILDPNPVSAGAAEARPDNRYSPHHTAGWGMRADYVLPSAELTVTDSGVFWPGKNEAHRSWVESRAVSSDHRLVWVDVAW